MTTTRRARALKRARLTWLALACLIQASVARAQMPQDANPEPDAEATMRFGPLALRPTIALSNAGVDTNVFNSSDNAHGDFTMTFAPELLFYAGRFGRMAQK